MLGKCHDGNPYHANHEETMKNLLIIFSIVFITGFMFTETNAKQSPTIDEIDALLKGVKKHSKCGRSHQNGSNDECEDG